MNKNRRSVLQAGVVGAAITTMPLAFPRRAQAAYTNAPGNDTVTFGFTVPQSGPFQDEGTDELNAFKLAVEHLNGEGDGGMINTMQPSSLQGNGVLGRRVEFLTGDTETRSSTATDMASALIDSGATMISGGSSSGVAIAMQELCQQRGIMFMAGLTHSNDTTGIDGKRYGFRHHINAAMSNRALGSYLTNKYQGSRNVYYITADYAWGWDNEAGFRSAFESSGWNEVGSVLTPLAMTDFTDTLNTAVASGADTLIMSLYGSNMVDALSSASALGLRDRQVGDNQMIMAIPLYSTLMARGAGTNGEGVYGTANWHYTLQDASSQTFSSSFSNKYGYPPSGAAHTCYVQTLLYADACERAGTFDPCLVAAALEGHTFSGLGNGATQYRADDHQCFKDVLIVKGKANGSGEFDRLQIDGQVARSEIEYASSATHGTCTASIDGDSQSNGDSTQNPTNSGSDNSVSSSGGGGSYAFSALAALSALIATKQSIKEQSNEGTDSE